MRDRKGEGEGAPVIEMNRKKKKNEGEWTSQP